MPVQRIAFTGKGVWKRSEERSFVFSKAEKEIDCPRCWQRFNDLQYCGMFAFCRLCRLRRKVTSVSCRSLGFFIKV